MGGRGGSSGGRAGAAGGGGGKSAQKSPEQINRDKIAQAIETVRTNFQQQHDAAIARLGSRITPQQRRQLDMQMDKINEVLDKRVADFAYNGAEGVKGRVPSSSVLYHLNHGETKYTYGGDANGLSQRYGAFTGQVFSLFGQELNKLLK